jgi:hypothetical protein
MKIRKEESIKPKHQYWCGNGGIAIHGGEIEEKVVVLRELHRAIIYTTEMSNQVTKSHVRMQFTVYLVK